MPPPFKREIFEILSDIGITHFFPDLTNWQVSSYDYLHEIFMQKSPQSNSSPDTLKLECIILYNTIFPV